MFVCRNARKSKIKKFANCMKLSNKCYDQIQIKDLVPHNYWSIPFLVKFKINNQQSNNINNINVTTQSRLSFRFFDFSPYPGNCYNLTFLTYGFFFRIWLLKLLMFNYLFYCKIIFFFCSSMNGEWNQR